MPRKRTTPKTFDRNAGPAKILSPIMAALGEDSYWSMYRGTYTLEDLNAVIRGDKHKPELLWQKPFRNLGKRRGARGVDGHIYRGMNAIITAYDMHINGYTDPRYVTYDRAVELGGHVRKGERGVDIVWWKRTRKQPLLDDNGDPVVNDDGDVQYKPVRRYPAPLRVFNVEQCDGLNLKPWKASAPLNPDFTPVQAAESLVAHYIDNGGPYVKHGGTRAAYYPSLHMVESPNPQDFTTVEEYYGTLFHELGHSTGHETLLNRKGVTDPILFGSEPYAQEELVAEMTSVMVRAEVGMHCDKCNTNSAAYIQGWRQKLKEDPGILIYAAAQAAKAAEVIVNNSLDYEPGEDES